MINRMMRNGDAPVLSLRDAMDRLLEQSFTPFGRGFVGEGQQTVPSNLWEDGNTYYLHILAPALDLSTRRHHGGRRHPDGERPDGPRDA